MPETTGNGATKVKGARRALLVGINNYSGFASNLPSCIADVEAMGELLSGQFGYQLATLIDGEVTQAALTAAIQKLCADVKEGDRICLFYSGHGTQIARNDCVEECLVLGDGTLYADDTVVAAFKGLPAGTALLVLDSCFSGGMAKAVGMGLPKTIPMLTQQATSVLSKSARYRPFGGRPLPSLGPLAGGRKKSLITTDEAQDESINALVVSACLETETAAASSGPTNGLSAFTYALLSAIANHGSPSSTSQLVLDATEELRRIGAIQTPQIKEPIAPAAAAELVFPILESLVISKSAPTGARARLLERRRPVEPIDPIDPRIQFATAFLNALTGVGPQ